MPRPATGHVRVVSRKGGDVFYAKLKIPRADGTTYEPQRRLGRVWSKRTRPPAGYMTRAQAEARLQGILDGNDPLVAVEPPSVVVTFRQACDEHLRYLEFDRQRKPSYVKDCKSSINAYLIPALGAETPVQTIDIGDVDSVRERLLSGELAVRGDKLAHKTGQKVLTLLGGILGRAKRKGWIAVNPCDDAEKITVRASDEFNVLTVEQVHAVTRVATDRLLGAMFTVAAFTGLRQGELLALRWRHVDFGNRIVHVRRNLPAGTSQEEAPKSHRARSVPMSDQAMMALDELQRREHFTGDGDLVFNTVVGGHLNDDNVRDAFYAALEVAELGHMRDQDVPIVFHDLRHTFGTMCAARGIDILKIQKWMGHADIQTTMRYLHYVPQHDDAARLTAAFNSGDMPPAVPRTTDMDVQLSATEQLSDGGVEPNDPSRLTL